MKKKHLDHLENYNLHPKFCQSCFYTLSYEQRKNKFCSKSCAAKYNNKDRIVSQEQKEKVSIALQLYHGVINPRIKEVRVKKSTPKQIKVKPLFKNGDKCNIYYCCICNKVHRKSGTKTCSTDCTKILQKKNGLRVFQLRYERGDFKGRSEPSWMEKSFKEWLIQLKIPENSFSTEVRFYNELEKKNYLCDFVFPKLNLIIELDGKHHEKRAKLDKIRDLYLTNLGWKVIRIKYKEYKNKSRIEEIKSFLNPLSN